MSDIRRPPSMMRRGGRASHGYPGFAPGSVPGLTSWLNPTSGVTTNSGHVTSWAPSAGSVSAYTNTGSGITQASGVNGRPSLHFDGTSYLGTTSIGSAMLTSSAWSVVVAFKSSVVYVLGANPVYYQPSFIGDTQGTYWGVGVDAVAMRAFQNDGAYEVDTTSIVAASPHYAIVTFDGAHLRTSLDGGALDVGAGSGAIASLVNTVQIGVDYTSAVFYSGDIGDLCTYNTTLSAASIATLNAGLKAKYGF